MFQAGLRERGLRRPFLLIICDSAPPGVCCSAVYRSTRREGKKKIGPGEEREESAKGGPGKRRGNLTAFLSWGDLSAVHLEF